MAYEVTGSLDRRPDNTWIRLRTLVLLRWLAIAGQAAALTVAVFWLDLALPLTASALAIGMAVAANLVAMLILPASHRLRAHEAAAMLLFDLAQLATLLALTGGLHNPFALFVIVPVAIAATGLDDRSTAVLALVTMGLVVLFAVFHLPLRTGDGVELRFPPLLEFGHGVAIVIGVGFLALYARRVSGEIRNMSLALMATQMALAREQKLTDLGGVIAAAAHELGTPLATIKLTSAELIEDLGDTPECEILRADAELIHHQADRCRDILRSMGRAGKDDLHLRHAPFGTVVRDAAEPHAGRGKELILDFRPGNDATTDPSRQPEIRRAPEIIHGVRNLIQNAVDFAAGRVWIEGCWDTDHITLRIGDDGPGYPPHLLGRIGDPFLRRRGGGVEPGRPGYEGMGLGLFIAKTLLERSGARLTFANGGADRTDGRTGAIVTVTWPRHRIEPATSETLGDNRPITA